MDELFKLHVSTTVTVDHRIHQTVRGPDAQGRTHDYFNQVIDVQEKQVYRALTELGWTPPPEQRDLK